MKNIAVTALAALALSGCASVDVKNPAAVHSAVTVERNDFKKVSTYYGPRFEYNNKWMYMRAAQAHSGDALTQQLVVHLSTWGWAFFDTAYDEDGTRLDVTVLDRSVFSCTSGMCLNNETIAINFPYGYLRAKSETGLRLQISGKRGEQVVQVPAAYLIGFRAAAPFAQ